MTQPPADETPTQYLTRTEPAPPRRRGLGAGALAGIVIGGILLLGLTFASGAAAAWFVSQGFDRVGFVDDRGWPGGSDRDRDGRDGPTQDDDLVTPAPSPTI